jgi:hypothetical protein
VVQCRCLARRRLLHAFGGERRAMYWLVQDETFASNGLILEILTSFTDEKEESRSFRGKFWGENVPHVDPPSEGMRKQSADVWLTSYLQWGLEAGCSRILSTPCYRWSSSCVPTPFRGSVASKYCHMLPFLSFRCCLMKSMRYQRGGRSTFESPQ